MKNPKENMSNRFKIQASCIPPESFQHKTDQMGKIIECENQSVFSFPHSLPSLGTFFTPCNKSHITPTMKIQEAIPAFDLGVDIP